MWARVNSVGSIWKERDAYRNRARQSSSCPKDSSAGHTDGDQDGPGIVSSPDKCCQTSGFRTLLSWPELAVMLEAVRSSAAPVQSIIQSPLRLFDSVPFDTERADRLDGKFDRLLRPGQTIDD